MERTYFSEETAELAGPVDIYVVGPGMSKQELQPRLDLKNHSPSGFSWGYRGSGPAQLAFAILVNELGKNRAFDGYQQFKDEIIAQHAESVPFLVRSPTIHAWAATADI